MTSRLPDEPAIHQCALAYASDLTLLDAALVPHGRTVFELATDTLKLARAGLTRRKHLDSGGRDETRYLEVLEDRLARGTTAAQELLEKYHGPWGGSVEPAFLFSARLTSVL